MRIVEIGSGSGGTSAVVLDALAGCGSRVDFVYTDLSPQLVAYGRRTFGPRYAFARFHTLDVERALAPQASCHTWRFHPPRASVIAPCALRQLGGPPLSHAPDTCSAAAQHV